MTSPKQAKYIRIETIISVVFNTVISVIFALVASQGVARVPMWGVTGMAVDFVPTVVMITLVTTIIETLLAGKRVRAGTIEALPPEAGGWLAWAPQNAILRGLVYALLAALVVIPVTVGLLALLGVDGMDTKLFIPFKAIYGAALAALITPHIVRAALARR